MTNADRIRNMSDEELTEFINNVSLESMDTISYGTKEYDEIWEHETSTLEWLRSEEATDEDVESCFSKVGDMEDRYFRYLFKGKTAQIVGTYNNGVENGVWVRGNLRLNAGKYTIFQFEFERADYVEYEIDPDTICQCTGLKDKNGNLIWENDIVKFDVYYYENLESSIISQIMWCNDLCALSLVVNDRGTRGTLGHLMDLNKEIEVIGNIFDNPELL